MFFFHMQHAKKPAHFQDSPVTWLPNLPANKKKKKAKRVLGTGRGLAILQGFSKTVHIIFCTFSRICSAADFRFASFVNDLTGRAVAKATGRGHVETDKQLLDEVVDDITRGTGEVEVVMVRSFIVKVGCFIVFYCNTIYRKTLFNCEYLLIANCEFFLRSQLIDLQT